VIAYASRTGTRRNLRALHAAGWRQLVAPGQRPTHARGWMLDNGAWGAHQRGERLDERAFRDHVIAWGRHADCVVAPDIIAGGLDSLALSERWLDALRMACVVTLIPVQDGMEPAHLEPLLSSPWNRWSRALGRYVAPVGIFVGGSTEWKLATMRTWGGLARAYGAWLHVGRVNSARRIQLCRDAGADSFDGTSVTMYADTLPLLDSARRQEGLFTRRPE
jgi:hypothetical protein